MRESQLPYRARLKNIETSSTDIFTLFLSPDGGTIIEFYIRYGIADIKHIKSKIRRFWNIVANESMSLG